MATRTKREEFGEIVLKDGDIADDILKYIESKGFKILLLYHLKDNKTHYEIIKETKFE